jgi:dTDP-4-amino-4,6-dideoxygalactose transaminase
MTPDSSGLALHGGKPVRNRPFPEWPTSDDSTAKAVFEVLTTGETSSTHGDVVTRFEAEFAAYQDAEYCTCVCNGTLALAAGLRAVGVDVGGEVILPSYAFVASAAAVIFAGGIPVFADVDPRTHLLDADAAEAAITNRTKAILPVHVAGRPADLDAFTALSQRHGVAIVEEASQAHGAEWHGRKVGAIGDVGVFGFQASSHVGAGDGGAVVTDDEQFADRLRALTSASASTTVDFSSDLSQRTGESLRLAPFQAAILRIQLSRQAWHRAARAANAERLTRALRSIDGVQLPPDEPGVTAHGHHGFLFRLTKIGGADRRDAFVQALVAEGIPCVAGYGGLHLNIALRDEIGRLADRLNIPYPEPKLAATEKVVADTVWLPGRALAGTEDDIRDVVTAVQKVLAAFCPVRGVS